MKLSEKKVRFRLSRRHMNMKDLADALGVSRQCAYKYFKCGRNRIGTIEKIADILGVSTIQIIE